MKSKNLLNNLLSSKGFRSYVESSLRETCSSGRECAFHVSFRPPDDGLRFPENILIGDKTAVGKNLKFMRFLEAITISPEDFSKLPYKDRLALINRCDVPDIIVAPDGNEVVKEIGGSDTYYKILDFHTHPYQPNTPNLIRLFSSFSPTDLKNYVLGNIPIAMVLGAGKELNDPMRGFLLALTPDFNGGEEDYGKISDQIARVESDIEFSRYYEDPLVTKIGVVTPFFYNGELKFNKPSVARLEEVLDQRPFLLKSFRK